MLRFELRDQLCLELAGLLGVEITHFLGNIDKGYNCLVVAFLRALRSCAASTAYVNGLFLALCVADKLARLLLNIPGGTRGLKDCPTNFLTLAIAALDQRLVALLDLFLLGLLFEGDLADLLKVLLADLFRSGLKLSHISVMALFNLLMCALKDGIPLQGGH